MNHYDLLGISPKASPEVVKAASRALLRMYHPDTKGTGDAARFREVKAASEILLDEQKRTTYNTSLRPKRKAPPVDHVEPDPQFSVDPHAYQGAYRGAYGSKTVEDAIRDLGIAMATEATRNIFSNLPPEMREVLKQATRKNGGRR